MKKPHSTKHMFLVELVLPQGMSSTNMCHDIRLAIQAEVGHRHPQDPMFDLDRRTVRVKNAHNMLTGISNALEFLGKAKGRK